jgi:spermidine synthase
MVNRQAAPGRTAAAGVLMLASGAAGLGCQMVWTQQATLWLGHDTAAVLAVLAAFFGGLALGAALLSQAIQRSQHPGCWYAGCEAVIALWSLVLLVGTEPAGRMLLQLTGAQPTLTWQWAVAFGGTLLLLLPATAAMGATLPAMDALLNAANTPAHDAVGQPHKPSQTPRSRVAGLYAANTAGAVLGVLGAVFWLVPSYGLRATAAVCVALNVACALVAAWCWASSRVPALTPLQTQAQTQTQTQTQAQMQTQKASLRWLLVATGALGIGQEVLVVRVLSQVAENTVYTFAMLLALYLVGTALGAAAYQRAANARAAVSQLGLLGWLLLGLAAACLLGDMSLWFAVEVKAGVSDQLSAGLAGALAAEALLAALAFVPPTLVMGALFSHLMVCARSVGLTLGHALALNTLGAATAPLLFGVLLLPALGAKAALLLVATVYALLALTVLSMRRGPKSNINNRVNNDDNNNNPHSDHRRWPPSRPAWALAGVFGVAGLLAVAAPQLRHLQLPAGSQLLGWYEGSMAAVSVVEDDDGVRRLHINNRVQEGDSHSRRADGRQALLPLLLHPAPQRALFLGLGTGITAATAALDPTLQVQAVELLPEVIAAAAHFNAAVGASAPPNLQVVVADARRHVRAAGAPYDLIVSDNFHPARSGSASLYTVEHFRAVQQRLAAGGVFCQWLPLHQMDSATLASIVRSFLQVYPRGGALLATLSLETPVLGLVSRRDGQPFDAAALRQRLATAAPALQLAAYGIADEWALLGNLVAGPQALALLAGDAPLNTDDHPVVAYRAPRLINTPGPSPSERLLALLPQLQLAATELLTPPPEPGWPTRLQAYRTARDQFLQAGRQVRPNADPQQMLAQVRAPLLAVLATSADFRPAYDPLLRLAQAVATADPAAARLLLADLARLQPARPEAGQALAAMGASP